MDLLLFTSFILFSFSIFQFNMLLMIFLFIFTILFLFNFFKTWIMMIIFMIYLGGIFILLIYVSSFSTKKNLTKNLWFLVNILFIYFFEENFNWIFSCYGMDFMLNSIFLTLFIFLLMFFLLILMSMSILCPMSKSIRIL